MKYIEPNWPAPAAIKAYTTVRTSWGEHLDQNHALKSLLNLPNEPIWLTQTHSTIVIEAKPECTKNIADASFTAKYNQVCVVLTADCLPILICNKQATCVAAIHAGWRGLASGIIEETLSAIKQNPDDLLIWLGPAIGPSKFEVGNDVYEAFVSKHSEATNGFTALQNGKWLANLYDLAKYRFSHYGINQIFGGEFCTYSQPDLFFSYRRDKGKTGRMASMIWIDAKT